MLIALPQPWHLGFIVGQDEETGLFHIGYLPVIALMADSDPALIDELVPYVAMQSGRILSGRKLCQEKKWQVLFFCSPTEDPKKVAQLALAARGWKPKEEGLEIAQVEPLREETIN